MSADFNTELTVRGTKEEYLAILKVLHTYADERYQQYREQRNCWYLDKKIGEVTEKTLESFLKNGVFSILLSGPYGVMNGPVTDEVDLFERLADAAPGCCFEGSISGWDPGAEQGIDAKLENGQLYLRYTYKEFGGEWDDEEEDDGDEDEEAGDADWDTVYDPVTHAYHKPTKKETDGDSVTVSITLTDLQGEKYRLVLPSEDIEKPINLRCFPRDFLQADTAEKLIDLLVSALDKYFSEGWKGAQDQILSWKDEIPAGGFGSLELKKIHDHKDPMFFGWMRSNMLGEKNNLKKPAKKVISCAAKNKQMNLEEFEKAVNAFEPSFPWCDWTGWPEFCNSRLKSAVKEKYGVHFEWDKNPDPRTVAVLDWRCAASDLEDFARLLCSREDPREYAVETVSVDYVAQTVKQSAVYMPGGPTPKPALPKTQAPAAADPSPEQNALTDACKGLTFVITGKVNIFENRDAFTAYVERQGGKVSGSVSKKTDYLVNNDLNSNSAKNQKAKELEVPVISEEAFVEKFGR